MLIQVGSAETLLDDAVRLARVPLLCEDHNGTYVLPFPCRWADGAWRSTTTGSRIEVNVVGWRRQ